MNRTILTGPLAVAVFALSACGGDADTVAVEDTAATDAAATAATIAPPEWPAGTRIVQEGDVVYRVDPAGTRVVIDDDSWRIVTEGDRRYRVDPAGTRIEIDDEGLDLEGVASGPDIPGVDVDVGTNKKGNLDVDVSTDGTDASNDRPGD
jgi:hypothetical protein